MGKSKLLKTAEDVAWRLSPPGQIESKVKTAEKVAKAASDRLKKDLRGKK